ncbi:MAG: M28 family peptidase, partial [Promethearchaeota archaeon]
MKRGFTIFLICLFIVFSPLHSGFVSNDDSAKNMFIPTVDPNTESTDISQQVFNTVSLKSYRDFIIELTQNGSRPVGTPSNLGQNNIAARNWIVNEMQEVSNGRIEVEVLGEWASVLGKLPGYLPVDAPALMVGGHYDSVSAAPGANDDATGVAAALELARVMSFYDWPLDIYFGCWNAEEIGLLGSQEVAQIMRDRGVELLAYYNVDMLLVPDPFAGTGEQVLMAYPVGLYHEGRYWAELTRAMSQNYGQHMINPVMSISFSGWERSDHFPFSKIGYTALFAHESGFEFDTAYHTHQDVWTNPLYDYDIATETVRAIGGAMAFTMARTYGEPTTHDLEFTLVPGNERDIVFAISTPTTINVTSRWFGGGTSITLFDSNDQVLVQMVDEEASPWEHTQIISRSVSSSGLYRLNAANYGGTSVGHEITISYETDIDGNDILDSQEFWFDQEYFSMDSDFDTISDAQEMIIGTDPFSNDTDSDSLPDPWEIEHGLNPLDYSDAYADQDGDGVLNIVEYAYNCDPNVPDSDSDTMPDLWEIEHGLDPT